MAAFNISTVVIPALKKHTSTIIVAHGLGDSGAGWDFLAHDFQRRSQFSETKFIFPNAPNIPITVSMGMRMPGWYDIADFGDIANRSEDEAGILRSQAVFRELIAAEVSAGIPSERIVLGGFSQGGAMSLLAGITNPTKLGGIFGLSSYLLLASKIKSMIPADNPNKNTPIFIGHGDRDPVVKYAWGQLSAEKLRDFGFDVQFKTYKGLVHSAAPEEIEDLAEYVASRIPPLGAQSA